MSLSWKDLTSGVETTSAEQTEAYGHALGRALPPDAVLTLSGDLGSGKTTFVRGMATAFGIEAGVHSPSFNLFFIHQGSRQLVHCDAYRLNNPEDFDDLLLEDFLRSPWLLAIEWPERIASSWLEGAWKLEMALLAEKQVHQLRLAQPE